MLTRAIRFAGSLQKLEQKEILFCSPSKLSAVLSIRSATENLTFLKVEGRGSAPWMVPFFWEELNALNNSVAPFL